MKAIDVFLGSDGDVTKAYYAELQRAGAIGIVAVNLFRAQKCSARAKVYRGGVRGRGSFRGMAYDRKAWSMENLCSALLQHPEAGVTFGWKKDPQTPLHGEASWVMYVDLPQGQVSFHSPVRYAGPDYPREFDGARQSAERILEFCDAVTARIQEECDSRQPTLAI
jgi:hypothetical protein